MVGDADLGFPAVIVDELFIVVVIPSNKGIAIGSFLVVFAVLKFVCDVAAVVIVVVVFCCSSKQKVSANKASLLFLSSAATAHSL